MALIEVSFKCEVALIAELADMAAREGQSFDHILIRCIIEGQDGWIRRQEQIGRQSSLFDPDNDSWTGGKRGRSC